MQPASTARPLPFDNRHPEVQQGLGDGLGVFHGAGVSGTLELCPHGSGDAFLQGPRTVPVNGPVSSSPDDQGGACDVGKLCLGRAALGEGSLRLGLLYVRSVSLPHSKFKNPHHTSYRPAIVPSARRVNSPEAPEGGASTAGSASRSSSAAVA